jgi:hypothetical protein
LRLSTKSGRRGEAQDQEYRASIDFNVEEKPVTYTLFHKLSFIASHPCINGPHLQHSNDMGGMFAAFGI